MRLQKSNEPDGFYSSETFFTTLDHLTANLMAMNLARKIHQEFLKQKRKMHHSYSKSSAFDQK